MGKDQKTAYKPDFVSPPGETLQDTIDMLGISQAELAERTGRPLQLELVLRVPASFWLARGAK